MLRSLFGVALASILAAGSSSASAEDWPQWRGRDRDGLWREDHIIQKFTGDHVPIVWRTEVGPGYSGPTVAGGRVYLSDRITKQEQQERNFCLDAKDGKLLWQHAYSCEYQIGYVAGPRACLTVEEGRAYALGAMGHFYCYRAESGEVLWQHDLNHEYSIRMPIWGIAAAPLVEGKLVIVQAGGEAACFVAFDKETGKEKWRALDDRASYAAPIIVEQAGQRLVVALTGDRVVALEPQTGKLVWAQPFAPRNMPIGIATPVLDHNQLLVTSFYDGSLLLHLDPQRTESQEIWRRRGKSERQTDALHSIISTPILRDGYIYGVDSYGELRCLKAETGERLWENGTVVPKARWSTVHFVQHVDKAGQVDSDWLFNERGELIIGRLSPEGFQERSRAKLLAPTEFQLTQRGGVCWSHPAFANRRVYNRNDEELVCGDLEEK